MLARYVMKQMLAPALASIVLAAAASAADPHDGGHDHPHHASLIVGASLKSDGKAAYTYGLEYQFRLHRRFALGIFYEWSDGDYEAEGGGIPASIFLTDEVKLLLAAGVERELFDDEQLLLRAGLGYDVHLGRFTLAPSTWVDFVHGKQILFAGLTAGIGF